MKIVSSTLAASPRVSPRAALAEAEARQSVALGAFAVHNAERSAAASSAPLPTHSCISKKTMLNLPHGRAHNYALASAELRSAPHHGDFVADSCLNLSWPYVFIALAIPSATA
jgi:hypothetical protein